MDLQEFKESNFISEMAKKNIFYGEESHKKIFMELIETSENILDFIAKVKKNEELKFSKGVAELFKDDRDYIESLLADKWKFTLSRFGCFKIGNDDFTTLIKNQFGNIGTYIAVVDAGTINTDLFNYYGSFIGKFYIYKSDYDNKKLGLLDGRFAVYINKGFVIFERWGGLAESIYE